MMDFVSTLRAFWWSLRQRGLAIRTWADLIHAEDWRGKSVAIVGNAGYLADLDQGRRIDGCDHVLRMNNCRTAGFERQVGTRTTIYLSTFHTDVALDNPASADAKHLVASVPANLQKHLDQGIHLRHGEGITAALLSLNRTTIYAPPVEDFARYIVPLGKYPTTGAAAILLAVQHLLAQCGQVFLTGFSFFEGPSHYYSSQQIVPKNHDVAREEAWLREILAPFVASGRFALDPVLAERFRTTSRRAA